MTQELERSLTKAKIGLMQARDTAFFSNLCCSLEIEFTDDIETAATNGLKIWLNPKFFEVLTHAERIFLLAHETMHVAYLHMSRLEERNHTLWNMAADYVINLELVDRGFTFIGDLTARGIDFPGGLLERKYRDMSTEAIYRDLLDNCATVNVPMDDLVPSSVGGAGSEAHEAKVQANIAKAIMVTEMANQQDTIPKSIQRHFSELTKPKVNWKTVLQRFAVSLTKNNYTWSRPNKRRLPTYMPTLRMSELARIDFAIDTSGSITKEQFTQFISEVHSVLRMLKPKEIGVYQFDHALQGSDVVKSIKDMLTIPFSGGGGTRPQCALDEFKKNKALGLIVLTDGHFYKQNLSDPKRPVIWVVYDNAMFTAPFGTTVHFSLKAA